MPSSRLLCVYCSSSPHLAPEYYATAEALGAAMPGKGWGLVYGGGKIGLMGAVARGVKQAGGAVIGVIPHFMKERELEFREADELHTVITMAERKAAMIARAQAYVALPGGIGTLEEISEVLTLRYLAQIEAPIVFLNQNGFYDDLLRWFDRMEREGFRNRMRDLYAVAATVDEIWPHLENPAVYLPEKLWQ